MSGSSALKRARERIDSAVTDENLPVPGWLSQSNQGRVKPGKSPTPGFHGGRWVQIAYVLIDFLCVCVNGLVAFGIRFWPRGNPHFLKYFWTGRQVGLPELHYASFLMLYSVLVLLLCNWQGLYQTPRNRTALVESYAVLKAIVFATFFLSAFVYLSGVKIVSRLVVVSAGTLNLGALIVWRLWKRRIVLRRAAAGIGAHNALIVGAGEIGQALANHLEENKLLGYCFTGFLDSNHSTHPKLLGKIDDLARVARANFVDDVFITIPSERDLVKNVAAQARVSRLNVKVVPELYDGLGWAVPISYVGEFPVMELCREPIPVIGMFIKRAMDIALSVLALLALFPLLLLISLVIKLDSTGPAIYRSKRVGRKGNKFNCYKFRTMLANADETKEHYRHLNERQGPTFKIKNDPRITRVGGLLRRYSLDEFPQLWNVLRGDMSLVGPRPHPLDDYARYNLEHLRRLDVRPGITGLWQVTARQDPSFEMNVRLDLEYIEEWSLGLDLKILLKTLPALLSGTGS